MPLSNKRRKSRLLRHAGAQEFIFFEPSLIRSKYARSSSGPCADLAPATPAHRQAASRVAVGSERPTTPCKCYGSITGRWWTGRRRRGTGTLAPKIYSSRSELAENLVEGRRSNGVGSLDFSTIRSVS